MCGWEVKASSLWLLLVVQGWAPYLEVHGSYKWGYKSPKRVIAMVTRGFGVLGSYNLGNCIYRPQKQLGRWVSGHT